MRPRLEAILAVVCCLFLGLAATPDHARAQTVAGIEDNADSIAVLIGNRQYRQTSVQVEYAVNDAQAMADWLVNGLGFRRENVFVLENATKGQFEEWFGDERHPQGRLFSGVRPGRSNVFVFYSGHGAPDVDRTGAYLIPVDIDPEQAQRGYSRDLLMRNLGLVRQRIGADRQLIVMLDACFSGVSAGGAIVRTSSAGAPLVFAPRQRRAGEDIVTISAAGANQVASWDHQLRLGLLTSRFLMGVSGLADSRDAGGNGDGRIRWSELQAFLDREVAFAARQLGRDQTPEVDTAEFELPVRRVARVQDGLVREEDRISWSTAQNTNTRRAFEDYVAACATRGACSMREAALGRIRDFVRIDQIERDRARWDEHASRSGYRDYLRDCGPICAYRDVAQRLIEADQPQSQPQPPRQEQARQEPPRQQPPIRTDERPPQVASIPPRLPPTPPETRPARPNEPDDVRALRRRAEAGEATAMVDLGFRYDAGNGVERDDAEALFWYRRAAELGNPVGMTNLGVLLREGRGIPRDFAAALDLFRRAAEMNHPRAMTNIGLMTERGDGVERDLAEAARWYRRAGEANDEHAMRNLALLLRDGRGVEQNHEEAVRWFRRAVDAGLAEAMNDLGLQFERGQGVQRDLRQAANLYRRAGNAGSLWGARNYAVLLRDGRGIEQNHEEAVRWFRRAADGGNLSAMNELGLQFERGHGVRRDNAEAVRWFRLAAEAGEMWAMRNLGFMLREGRGIAQNHEEAVRWFRRAAEAGHSEGMNDLGLQFYNGWGVPQDDRQAVAWFRRAAERNDPWGMNNYAMMLRDGRGVARNLDEARLWFQRAVQAGNRDAQGHLDALDGNRRNQNQQQRPQQQQQQQQRPPQQQDSPGKR